MTRSLAQLDAIAHDPLQTHLPEFANSARGPYPAHAHGTDE